MLNFLLRIVLFLVGLVFAASLVVAVLILALVWGLRYGWARMTGRPVDPWLMGFDARGGFDRFRARARAATPAAPSAADVAAARARGEAADSPVGLRDPARVSDVQARPVPRKD
jgi:hypothetical protein